jgi:predicted ATP-dependent Lon-type protease
VIIFNETDKDEQFLHCVISSDEVTFHVSGHVHWHNVRLWANKCPSDFVEHEHNSPKVEVWCAVIRNRVICPYFFEERTVTSHNYLSMLELFSVPQIDDDNVIFQQDGAPAHYANIGLEFLDETFPQR